VSSSAEPSTEPDLDSSTESGNQMILLRVSPSGELSTEQLPSPGGFEQRSLPLADGRVALTGSTVSLVKVR
jgi:hypothetical protein